MNLTRVWNQRTDPESTKQTTAQPEDGRQARRRLRRRTGTLTLTGAIALAVGLTLAPIQASPALAYSAANCGPGLLVSVDTIRTDAGFVDIGDDPHVTPAPFTGNGMPLGNAIVCWYANRSKVQVVAKLYNDKLNGNVRALIDFYRLNGSSTQQAFIKSGGGAGVTNLVINTTVPMPTLDLYRVRIQLQTKPAGSLVYTTVATNWAVY